VRQEPSVRQEPEVRQEKVREISRRGFLSAAGLIVRTGPGRSRRAGPGGKQRRPRLFTAAACADLPAPASEFCCCTGSTVQRLLSDLYGKTDRIGTARHHLQRGAAVAALQQARRLVDLQFRRIPMAADGTPIRPVQLLTL
jgi:hypothetical protein